MLVEIGNDLLRGRLGILFFHMRDIFLKLPLMLGYFLQSVVSASSSCGSIAAKDFSSMMHTMLQKLYFTLVAVNAAYILAPATMKPLYH